MQKASRKSRAGDYNSPGRLLGKFAKVNVRIRFRVSLLGKPVKVNVNSKVSFMVVYLVAICWM